jgi:hypothetical protein
MDYAIFIINNAEIILRISIMQYNLQLDRDADAEIVVKQLTSVAKNAKLPLTLYGQGRPNYGQELQNNFFYLLENFCGEDAPLNPAVGMLWYDSALKYLKLFTGESYPRGPWLKVDYTPSLASSAPPLSSANKITWTVVDFAETSANTGIVVGKLTATLSGTTFKTTLVNGTDYNITNVPTGLIPKVDVTSSTVEISFTGSSPLFNMNTTIFKVSFNISAFTGLTGNIADMVSSPSYDATITFIPPPAIVPKIINSFDRLTHIALKDFVNNVYDIFIDTYNYGSYIVYDSTKTVKSTGSLITLNNALGNYACTNIPNSLIVSSDYMSFSQIMTLPPKNIGITEYKLVKYIVNVDGSLSPSIDTSLSDITITANTKKIDDTGYIVDTIANGNNAQQVKIYDSVAKTTTTYPTNALSSSNITILDTPNDGYNLQKQIFISKNTNYDINFYGVNLAGDQITYNLSNNGSLILNNTFPIHFKSNSRISQNQVCFTIMDVELRCHAISSTGTSVTGLTSNIGTSIDKPTSVTDERVPTPTLSATVILDVIYCGKITNTTDELYLLLTMNNNKKLAQTYTYSLINVKNTITGVSDISAILAGSPLSGIQSITYPAASSTATLYKLYYNYVTGQSGRFFNE